MKKSILLFLPALLVLSSCNSNLMIHTPEEVVEVVNSFTSVTYSIYNYTITGNALGIEANRTSNDNVFIDDTYYEGETPTTYSSRMLSLPLILEEMTFILLMRMAMLILDVNIIQFIQN